MRDSNLPSTGLSSRTSEQEVTWSSFGTCCPSHHCTLVTSVPRESQFFTVFDPCGASSVFQLVRIPTILFTFTWEHKHTWTEMPQGSRGSLLFKDLKSWLGWYKVFCRLYLIWYIDDLVLQCPSQTSSQEDSIYLLQLLALKGRKIPWRKTAVCSNLVWF